MNSFKTSTCWFVACCLMVVRLSAQETTNSSEAAGLVLFESKIRPMLVQHCYKCHSRASRTPEGGLLLDTRDGIRKGGDRGPAVVPEKPQESILLSAISHADPDLQMPPKKDRLPADLIREVENWIRMGAPDPRTAESSASSSSPVDIKTGRQFWSYKKPTRPTLPPTRNSQWAKSDIDRFVLAKLEAANLTPSADAEPAILLRRLHFDLVGLPPSPQAQQQFLKRVETDGMDSALAMEADALIASKHFGERWGRHWLDVARFAESSGKEANISFPYAWRYRDYVIDCFNADLPFDRFLVEQIAGDLLPADSDAERARLLVATGFLAVGPKNLEEGNADQFTADVIDEQIDAVTRAVMANSVACARCHDHKFDPFLMEDYYALAGVFASTKTFFGTAVSPANRVAGDPLRLPRVEGQSIFHPGIPAKQVESLKTELAALQKEQKEGMAAVMKAVQAGEDPGERFTLRDALRIFWKSGAIEGQLEKVDESGQPLPLAMGVLDREKVVDAPLLERGDISRPGKNMPRGFPQVIELSGSDRISANQSGRLEFAHWLTHPDHPLTARVAVNRIWHYLFGAGLVRSVDNFGLTGELPSHPELLDQLTVDFLANDWSVKKLVRQIVLTRTYRQASTYDAKSFQVDPDDRLLWRSAKRRLDAEVIRDAMLAVSGELDATRPAGSLVARVIGDRPISLIGLDSTIPADLDGMLHRSVYLPVLRDRLPDVLDLFDFAEPSLVTGARETTNVPVQALYLMNSPFVQDRAKSLAGRLEQEESDERRVRKAFLLCFSRSPDSAELSMAKEFLEKGRKSAGDNQQLGKQVLMSYCQALLSTAEFRNLD